MHVYIFMYVYMYIRICVYICRCGHNHPDHSEAAASPTGGVIRAIRAIRVSRATRVIRVNLSVCLTPVVLYT